MHLLTYSLFLTTIFMINTALAENEYKWLKEKDNFFSGHCYQINSDQENQQRLKVKKDLCRPSETELLFYPQKGFCYEIDIKTRGVLYTNKVDTKKCQPQKTITRYASFIGKDGCYSVDAETRGEKYFKKIDSKLCHKNKVEYFFKLNKEKFKGDCYTKNTENELIKVNISDCKPSQIVHKFYRQGALLGKCFEQDSRSPEYYLKPTSIELCRPKETSYVVITPEFSKESRCFEIDKKTKGEKFIKKVPNKFCQE